MPRKTDAQKNHSEERLKELLSKENDKLKRVLIFMNTVIKESSLPWISWKMLSDNAGMILGNSRRPEHDLWAVMQPVTQTLVDRENEPEVENPEFYEYKIGNTWIYYPAKMIELYCNK